VVAKSSWTCGRNERPRKGAYQMDVSFSDGEEVAHWTAPQYHLTLG
jgi:hypothetical protein